MSKLSELSNTFGGRLVTLCDGRPGLRGGLRVEARVPAAEASAPTATTPPDGAAPPETAPGPAPEAGGALIDFIASDETLDRCDEIIAASGWRLAAYCRNPVFQNAHQYGDILFTLGRALITEVRAGRLFQRVQFATEVNPVARIAYGLYRGGFLNAVSVGFIPLRWETGSAEAGFKRRYLEQELLEVSAVGIPANPNALQLGLKAGVVEKLDLQEWLDLLRQLGEAAGPADPGNPALSRSQPAPPESGGESWLRLARAVRELLRGA